MSVSSLYCCFLRFLPPLALLASLAPVAWGQGLLIDNRTDIRVRLPRPVVRPMPEPQPGSYKIESIEVDAKLKDQVARVQVSQTFRNTGSRQMEVAFVFPLPYDGAIDGLTLMVEGKEFDAELLPADEARKLYEEIVRRNQDPALLEWLGTGLFKTSVFPLPAGAERTVTLRYTQLCRKTGGLTDFLFPLSTAKYTSGALEKLRLRVAIESAAPIANVYSPTHKVKVGRPDGEHAVVTFEAKNELPASDFRLFYDQGGQGIGASVVSYRPEADQAGYFLLLASPEIEAARSAPVAKTVLFVVDRSGSMSGKKIEQARGALKFVLNNLREGDTFNVIAYDSQVETFRPELQKYDDKTHAAAIGFVEGLFAGGSTNIDAALTRALGMLKDESRPTYVLFLTDGLPTAGERSEAAIVAASESKNKVRARVIPFGVGYDVNSRLLDRLARAHHGQTEYVRPDQDIEDAVSKLYNRIAAPVMTDVAVTFDLEGASASDGDAVNQLYPKGAFDLFAGDQAVVVGRYRQAGRAKVTLQGDVAGEKRLLKFPAELVPKSDDDANAFVARLWATRRVGEIIDEIDLNGKNDELVKELVNLATRHGILTRYTSFLADEDANPQAVAENLHRAETESLALADTIGRRAFGQRRLKAQLKSAPAYKIGGDYQGLSRSEREEAQAGRSRGQVQYFAKAGENKIARNIRQIGRKTFFQQGVDWVDSSVTEVEAKNPRVLQRYGDEYFEMVAKHGRHIAPYLAIEDSVIVKIDGVVYQW